MFHKLISLIANMTFRLNPISVHLLALRKTAPLCEVCKDRGYIELEWKKHGVWTTETRPCPKCNMPQFIENVLGPKPKED